MYNGKSWQYKVVVLEAQTSVCFRVIKLDPSDLLRVLPSSVEACDDAGLIADQTACTINLTGVYATEPGVALGPDENECLREMDYMEPGVIEIASVHDIERSGLRNEVVKDIDVVNVPLAIKAQAGMLPLMSSKACNLTAAFVFRNVAHGNRSRHRSMMVESSA